MKELDPLILSIRQLKSWTENQLAAELKYGPGYFSQLRSREKSENKSLVTQKLYDRLKDLEASLLNANTIKPENVTLKGHREYTLQDYIDKVEEQNQFLQEIVRAGLIDLKASSGKILQMLDKTRQQLQVNDVLMMDSLDRLEERPEGTLAEAADNSELALEQIRKGVGKPASSK